MRVLVVACSTAVVGAACTGGGVPDVSAQRCYAGSEKVLGFGETFEITMEDFAVDSGHFHLTGSGFKGINCGSHQFTKEGQTINTDLGDCLPKNVLVEDIKYCSDQDRLEVKVNDKNIPFGAGKLTIEVNNVACAEELKATSSCSGSGIPDVSTQRCYADSEKLFGLEITVEDFAADSGHFHLADCGSHQFTKDGQTINTDLSDCLPKNVLVEEIKYCSDQDTVQVKVNDKNIPFGAGKLTVEAKNVACGEELKATSSCSGSGIPDVSAHRCYAGSKKIFGYGETLEITMEDFAGNSGHFHLTGSGFKGINCGSHQFTKEGQTINTDLGDCLPKNVLVEDIKYCSDQDRLEVKVDDKNIPFGAGKLTIEVDNVACGVGALLV